MVNLTVIYDGKVDTKLDKQIEEALKPLGFRRWASGFNFCEGKRDLAFEKKEPERPRKRLELVTRVIDGDTRPGCGKKTKKGKRRKHTPIVSEAQQGKFGSELARRRAGKDRRMRGITTEELESHLEESKGKNLPKRKSKKGGYIAVGKKGREFANEITAYVKERRKQKNRRAG